MYIKRGICPFSSIFSSLFQINFWDILLHPKLDDKATSKNNKDDCDEEHYRDENDNKPWNLCCCFYFFANGKG